MKTLLILSINLVIVSANAAVSNSNCAHQNTAGRDSRCGGYATLLSPATREANCPPVAKQNSSGQKAVR